MKIKVCLIGDFQVGKTSLIRRFVLDQFDDHYLETIGTKVSKKSLNVDHPTEEGILRVELMIWDIMGSRKFGDLLREAYFYGTDGIIGVCDLTRPETVDGLRDWIDSVLRVAGEVPVHVIANKSDLDWKVDEQAIEEFAQSYESPYHITSAKTGDNVEVVFADVAIRVSRLQYAELEAREKERVPAPAD